MGAWVVPAVGNYSEAGEISLPLMIEAGGTDFCGTKKKKNPESGAVEPPSNPCPPSFRSAMKSLLTYKNIGNDKLLLSSLLIVHQINSLTFFHT